MSKTLWAVLIIGVIVALDAGLANLPGPVPTSHRMYGELWHYKLPGTLQLLLRPLCLRLCCSGRHPPGMYGPGQHYRDHERKLHHHDLVSLRQRGSWPKLLLDSDSSRATHIRADQCLLHPRELNSVHSLRAHSIRLRVVTFPVKLTRS